MTQTEYDELFEDLPIPMQQAVARGDIKLDVLIEMITSASGAELCPQCCMYPVRHSRLGLCSRCARDAMNAAMHELLSTLDAQREGNRLKKAVQRSREDCDPTRARPVNGSNGGG